MAILNVVSGLLLQLSTRRPLRRRPPVRRCSRAALTLEALESRVCLSLLISSNRTNEILSYDANTGDYQGVFASGGGLMNPGDLVIGPDGNLYVSSNGTNNVLRYDGTTGAFIDVFTQGGDLEKPSGIAFGPDGNLYVNGHSNNSVQRFDGLTGQYIDTFVPSGSGGLSGPSEGLAFGPDGNLYINSTGTNDIRRFKRQTGEFIDVFTQGGDLMDPSYVLFGPDGNLYVGSHIVSRILRYDGTTGEFIDAFVTDSSGGLRNPTNFQFGPDGNLYVNSRGTQNVLRYDGVTGDFIDVFIPRGGELNAPTGMLFTSDGATAPAHAASARAPGKDPHTLPEPVSAQVFMALSRVTPDSRSNSFSSLSVTPVQRPGPLDGGDPLSPPRPSGEDVVSRPDRENRSLALQGGDALLGDPLEPMQQGAAPRHDDF
jgi:streptogramin lyase